jgi:hypothetical protein
MRYNLSRVVDMGNLLFYWKNVNFWDFKNLILLIVGMEKACLD